MKIVAIGLSHNEADVIQECVRDALSWVDTFILYDNSTDGTGTLAREAGAVVLPGDVDEVFNEGLRQHALDYAAALNPDWIVRIDPDEFYPRGVCFEGGAPQSPRNIIEVVEQQGFLSIRANVIQFWITLDDVRRGCMLEDESIAVRRRRRWYTVGHTAVVAWKHNPELAYPPFGSRKNTPLYPDGQDVGRIRLIHTDLIQTHYPCRSLRQLCDRTENRRRDLASFGKYAFNLIIDEKVAGMYHWDGKPFKRSANHDKLTEWFTFSSGLYEERGL